MRPSNPKVNYGKFLSEMWQLHLVPREPDAPTVISTFAGCGGSSLGYSMAGFRELLAVEWDPHAVQCFKLNFPEVSVFHGDIAKLSVEQVLKMTRLRPGELDVFDGSPPCQGFSTAGKRELNDDRNQLFREYVRLLEGLRPKAFVMENVSGMVKGKMKLIFAEILRTLKGCGYQVKACLLNAMYFNVPQARERMIFIGVRNDLGRLPTHPKAVSGPITVAEGIRNVIPSETPPFNDKYSTYWDKVPIGGNAGDVIGKGYNNCAKLNPNRPACTLPKTQTGRGFATIAHWAEKRAISISEAKRFGSFPDEFQLIGAYSDQWARIGNSVPPLMMKAVAEHIRCAILEKTLAHQAEQVSAA